METENKLKPACWVSKLYITLDCTSIKMVFPGGYWEFLASYIMKNWGKTDIYSSAVRQTSIHRKGKSCTHLEQSFFFFLKQTVIHKIIKHIFLSLIVLVVHLDYFGHTHWLQKMWTEQPWCHPEVSRANVKVGAAEYCHLGSPQLHLNTANLKMG